MPILAPTWGYSTSVGVLTIFEQKVCEALANHQTSSGKKHQPRDAGSGTTPKRARSASNQHRHSTPSEEDQASTSSKSSTRSGDSKLKKGLKVEIGMRYQTAVSKKAPSLRKADRYRRSSTSSSVPATEVDAEPTWPVRWK